MNGVYLICSRRKQNDEINLAMKPRGIVIVKSGSNSLEWMASAIREFGSSVTAWEFKLKLIQHKPVYCCDFHSTTQ